MRLLLLIVALATVAVVAEPALTVRVVDVHDGDTVRLLDGRRVRLWGIDAPELRQPWGPESRDHLAALVRGREVQLEPHGEDRYGRLLAVLRVGGRSANHDLVARGLAWWFRKYTPEAHDLEALELEARRRRLGLWSQAHPLAPWDFRHPPAGR